MILKSVEKRRNKIILKFNDYENVEINYDVYLSYPLYKEDEVSEKRINEIKLANAEYEVKNSAFRFLSNRNHSTFELKNKLKKKGYEKSIIEKIIVELSEKKYLNDYSFAQNFVNNRVEIRKEGVMKITSELFKKGIKREIISEVTQTIKENPKNILNALDLGKSKLEKIRKRGETDYNKIKTKIFMFLKGRGFTSDVIFEVIGKLNIKDEDNE